MILTVETIEKLTISFLANYISIPVNEISRSTCILDKRYRLISYDLEFIIIDLLESLNIKLDCNRSEKFNKRLTSVGDIINYLVYMSQINSS